jgi:hypothetical protein
MNEDKFKKTRKRFFIIRQTSIFIILLIVGRNKEVNNLSHPLILVSGLIEYGAKTLLERSRGERLYER